MKVTLKNLTKVFPARTKNDAAVTAVDGLDFEVPDGKLVGLLGPSGCGKSTALNMICGLIKPTGGRIYFGDTDVTRLEPEHRGVGMVFQNYALYPHMTVKQNILFPLQNLKGKDKLPKSVMLERVGEAAALVQIENLLERKPSELSGGQQQRVAIARALVKRPNVLLLDEPLSNLDARLRIQTRENIRSIQKQTGITTVFVTHDQEEAMSICDMIVVMEHGALKQIGEPQRVYDDPADLFVAKFLGTPPIAVFDGEIRDGWLYIGSQAVLKAASLPDGAAWAGIRPEGFLPKAGGAFTCTFKGMEVMGRETSMVLSHEAAQSPSFRAIVASGLSTEPADGKLSFDLEAAKVFVFDKKSGKRLKRSDEK